MEKVPARSPYKPRFYHQLTPDEESIRTLAKDWQSMI
jgi:hypothetical protein